MDRAKFFAAVRRRASGVFGTSLTQGQVDGVNGILDAFATHGDGRDKAVAYALSTGFHGRIGRSGFSGQACIAFEGAGNWPTDEGTMHREIGMLTAKVDMSDDRKRNLTRTGSPCIVAWTTLLTA